MRKAVSDIIAKLKKLPEPGKKTGSFWDFMKSQLMEEGQWDQKHIKTIENEIDALLSKMDKKTLADLWRATPAGEEKFDDDIKADPKEMKTDIIDEMIGQVMDRMDDNYSSRDSYFPPQNDAYAGAGNTTEEDKSDEDVEPDGLSDEDLDLDDDMFTEGDEDEDDEYRY